MRLLFAPSPLPGARHPLWQRLVLLTAALVAPLVVGCASLPVDVPRPVSTALAAPEASALGQLVQSRRAAAQARHDSGFKLLDSENLAFGARLALIDAAQKTLDLQYYAIHADGSTELLLQRLSEAARRGVRVRLLLDDLNTAGPDAQVLRLAFEPGIDIRLFNPLPGNRSSLLGRLVGALHDIPRLQKRMHNKLFLADNTLGIIGGRNLGDAYFGQDAASNFVDLDVLAAGRVVRDMSASFDRYWNNPLAYPVQSLVSPAELDALRTAAAASGSASSSVPGSAPGSTGGAAPAAAPPPMAPGAVLPNVTATAAPMAPLDLATVPLVWAPSVLLADQPGKVGPDDDEADAGETVVDGLLQLMGRAQREVLIVSPYFVPGPQMMAVFAELRGRSVRVRVLTNSLASNDAPAAHAGYARHRKALLALGVELYEMRSDQAGTVRGLGSVGGSVGGSGGSAGSSSGAGSAAGTGSSARASLHSKAVIIDGRVSVIGSMNLDLRSQRENSEVALLIRSRTLAGEASRQIEGTFASGAYRVELESGQLRWRAPPGARFTDTTQEPDASTSLRLLVFLLGPLAPDEML